MILRLKSKHVLTAANWIACLNGENGPGGTPSHEALSVSPQRALEITSVVGLPPSLDRNHFSTPRVVAESHKCDERCRPSSQTPQYPTLYRCLKRRLGCSLRASLYKRSVVRQGKRLHINILELKAVSLALQRFKDQCQNQTVLVAMDNSTVVHKQTKRNPLGGDVRSPVEDHDLVPSLPDNLKCQTHSRVSECDGRLSVQVEPSPVNRMITASAGVQTDLSQLVHSLCRSICHSSEPQSSTVCISSPRPKCLGHRCSQHKLVRSHCLCLASPLQGDQKNQAILLPDHCNSPRLARDALVLGPSAALNRDPTSTTSVKNSSQIVPQLCVSHQCTTSKPPCLVSRSGQLQEQGFSVEVAERIAAPPSEVINKDHLQVKVGPI